MITYVPEPDSRVQEKVRRRFRRESAALAACGFHELGFCRERYGPFSAITFLPVLLAMMVGREVLQVHERCEASAAFILMGNNDPATVALPMGLGVKLYTCFTDETVLISTNFASCVDSTSESVVKQSARVGIEAVWSLHQQRVRELQAQGRQMDGAGDFDRWAEMFRREDRASVCAPPWKPGVRKDSSAATT